VTQNAFEQTRLALAAAPRLPEAIMVMFDSLNRHIILVEPRPLRGNTVNIRTRVPVVSVAAEMIRAKRVEIEEKNAPV
jgi:hypothetical protein